MSIHHSAKVLTLTVPEIREARVRAEVRGEVDARTYAAALDVLESVLDQLQRGDTSLRELGYRGPLSPEHAAVLASVEWNAKDAYEALLCAVALADFAGVKKYAGQVETLLERRLSLAPGVLTLFVDGMPRASSRVE